MPGPPMPAPLLIADVPWLLYRAFFSLPKSIVGADGQPVNALLGTVNAILAVLEARPARAVAACMGAEEAVYRVELYPGYHAQREPMPPELAAQWEQGAGAAREPRLDVRDGRRAGGRRRDVLVCARRAREGPAARTRQAADESAAVER